MAIYTKTGDKGETALFGGKRLPKYHPQVDAYGMVDEATSFIGWAYESITDDHTKRLLTTVQYSLYKVMAYLSGAKLSAEELHLQVTDMEKEIDSIEKKLPKLTRFIIPQGSESTARLHIARSQIRRAERRVTQFIEAKEKRTPEDEVSIKYLNRLSDLLFTLARKFSAEEKIT